MLGLLLRNLAAAARRVVARAEVCDDHHPACGHRARRHPPQPVRRARSSVSPACPSSSRPSSPASCSSPGSTASWACRRGSARWWPPAPASAASPRSSPQRRQSTPTSARSPTPWPTSWRSDSFGMLAYPYLAHALLRAIRNHRAVSRHRGARHLAGGRRRAHLQAAVRGRCRAADGDGDQADAEHLSGGRHPVAHLDARTRRRRDAAARRSSGTASSSWTRYVPGFVLGFLGDGRGAVRWRRDGRPLRRPRTGCWTPQWMAR